MTDLVGKVAIVTGGGRGIGEAIAALFAAKGASVAVTDIDPNSAEAVAARLREHGGRALACVHDVGDEDHWQHVLSDAAQHFGRVDILVNNAGRGEMQPLTEIPLDHWRQVMAVNCDGVFLGMKHAVPVMRECGGGSIINMSSIYGKVGGAGSVLYCATKGAVTLMTKAAALECAGWNIRINSIHPGFIDTPLLRQSASQDVIEQMRDRHPIGRFGQPDDIADAALFLASDASRFMTGAELVVDGGYTAQ